MLEQNKIVEHIQNTFKVPCEKSKIVSFTSSIIKNINLLLLPLRFPVKLICSIAFGLASSACCLLKNLLLSFYAFRNNCDLANN